MHKKFCEKPARESKNWFFYNLSSIFSHLVLCYIGNLQPFLSALCHLKIHFLWVSLYNKWTLSFGLWGFPPASICHPSQCWIGQLFQFLIFSFAICNEEVPILGGPSIRTEILTFTHQLVGGDLGTISVCFHWPCHPIIQWKMSGIAFVWNPYCSCPVCG